MFTETRGETTNMGCAFGVMVKTPTEQTPRFLPSSTSWPRPTSFRGSRLHNERSRPLTRVFNGRACHQVPETRRPSRWLPLRRRPSPSRSRPRTRYLSARFSLRSTPLSAKKVCFTSSTMQAATFWPAQVLLRQLVSS